MNLLVDLDDARFAERAVHHAMEALDCTGITPVRHMRAPEPLLSWIDAHFEPAWSACTVASGAVVAERAGRPVGFAAFDQRGVRARYLQYWARKNDVGFFGPLGVVPELRGTSVARTLLQMGFCALRERGYRKAVVPLVGDAALVAYFEREAAAYAVESVDVAHDPRRFRTTVLASGNGSNFAHVAAAAARGDLPLEIVELVVNKADAYALRRAESAGVPSRAVVWQRTGGETREDFDARVIAAVAATAPALVLLLGWMHVLPATFIARFPQIVNLHPAYLPYDPGADNVTMPDGSSLPAFRGARAVDDALAAGSRWFGASVHRVGVAVDRGELLARTPLPLVPGEPRAAVEERLHAAERRMLEVALRRWAYEMP